MAARIALASAVVLAMVALLLAPWPESGPGEADPRVPARRAWVTDFTGRLTLTERATLERSLSAFERGHGSQVSVLLVPSTQPEPIERYSLRVANTWRLGRQDINDGVLLLVAVDDRTVRIEVGTGLERTLTNPRCAQIINQAIVPAFREGAFFRGIEAGIGQILGAIREAPLLAHGTAISAVHQPLRMTPVGDAVYR